MTDLRDLLFGDVPLEQWAGTSDQPPWTQFQQAAHAITVPDIAAADAALQAVLAMPDLESRQYLQAWSALRQLDRAALDGEPEHLCGVVLDVPLAQGWDTVAAYDDHTARYLNQGGGAIIWDTPEFVMDAHIDAVLNAARPLLAKAGVWDGARPPLTAGLARVSLLTPQGLHFGEAAFDHFLDDEQAGPMFQAAARLMSELIAHSEHH